MKLQQKHVRQASGRRVGGFTLVETIAAVTLSGIILSSLYACFGMGLSIERLSSEDLRATQILLQRLERARLCPFDQITDTTYNPRTSSEAFGPAGAADGNGGTVYTITFSPSVPAVGTLPESYRTNMLLLTVGVSWKSGGVERNRSMQTLVARSGIQSYVINGR